MDHSPAHHRKAAQYRLLTQSAVAAFSAASAVLLAFILALSYGIHLRSHFAETMSSSIGALSNSSLVLRGSIDSLSKQLKYHACCNKHVATIEGATYVTGLAIRPGGYVASSWSHAQNTTELHFFTENLALTKKCQVGTGAGKWKTHRLFGILTANSETVFYSDRKLRFVSGSDCGIREVDFATDWLGGVVETGRGEYLVAHGEGKGTVSVSLVGSDRRRVWSKEVAGPNAAVYMVDTAFMKLAGQKYVLAFRKSQSKSHTSDTLCVATIELAPKPADVKIVSRCYHDFAHAFGLVAGQTGAVLGLGVDSARNLVVFEIDSAWTIRTRLVVKEEVEYMRDFGAAYQASDTRFAFVGDMVQPDTHARYVSAVIYDYPNNRITNSVSMRLDSSHAAPKILSSSLQHYGKSSFTLTVRGVDGFAVIPANGDRVVKVEGNDKGFWHMVPAGDGGYVVSRPQQPSAGQKVWKYFPWQDMEAELDCSGVL